MKKITIILIALFTLSLSAQAPYEKGMSKALELWKNNKTTEATQLFERISNAEKDNWLPPFYAATIEILGSFGLKDETELKAKLTKAQTFLDKAMVISENNAELIITQALLNTAYIAFDGQKYGMTLSGTNYALYAKALKMEPNNPRVILGKAEWEIGGAKFFGKSIESFCKDVERALVLFKNYKPKDKFYPTWGKERAEEILKNCSEK